MPFIADILNHRSLSIVGMAKNTGKTVCLNYILRRLHELQVHVGVTSIGVDGEQTDAVFATAKPEVTLYEGTHFITSAIHYLKRQVVSCIEATDERRTALGTPVAARVLVGGKVLLSGAATTQSLLKQLEWLNGAGCKVSIVDGALSRLSLASPAVTDAMILATGAAVSVNINTLVSKTRFLYSLIGLEAISPTTAQRLSPIESGLWALDSEQQLHPLNVESTFLLGNDTRQLLRYGTTLFVAGAVSDRLLKALSAEASDITLIARDFTKLFITPTTYTDYVRHGGKIVVLQKPHLIAMVFNPTSPQGFTLDSARTCGTLADALGVPVYDIMKIER